MIRTMLKVLPLAGLLFLQSLSHAAGLGELKVISALGQPLKAEIDLVSMKSGESESLQAQVAPADAYRLAGVAYNPLLTHVKVSIAARPGGQPYIRLTSPEIVNDPFLDVLIQLSWSSGQLTREYTMLFDPVELAPQAPAVSPPVALPERRLSTPEAASIPGVRSGQIGGLAKAGKYGPVKRGETLSGVALATKPDDVTLEQMLVALYRANAEAFAGKNMNRLEAGKILNIPGKSEIEATGKNEAAKFVRIQAVDWNSYRQKLASSVVERGGGLKRSVSGKITTSVEGKEAPVPPQPKEVLRLSKGEASSANTKAEEQAANIKSMNDASERILALEKNIQDMKKLLALKNKALSRTKTGASAPLAIAKPVAAPKAPPSFLDELMGNPVLIGVAGGAVLGLAGVGLLIARRRKAEHEEMPFDMPAVVPMGRRAEHVLEKPAIKAKPVQPEEPEEPDPLEEAKLYFSYRRYAQAEALLNETLQADPSNFEAYLLLLRVHAFTNDKAALELAARKMQAASPPAEIWEKAMEIGFAADPKNPLYGGAVRKADQEPAAIDLSEPAMDGLDFDLDFDMGSSASSAVDLDLGQVAEEQAAAEEAVDFDMSQFLFEEEKEEKKDESPVGGGKAAGEVGDVDFDLFAMMADDAQSKPAEEAVDFDMSSMVEAKPAHAAEEEAVDFDLSSMVGAESAYAAEDEAVDFDLSSMVGAKPAENDGAIDFDLSSVVEETPVPEESPVDYDFSAMLKDAPAPEQSSAHLDLSSMVKAAVPEEAPVDYDFSTMLGDAATEIETPAEEEEPIDFTSMMAGLGGENDALFEALEELPPAEILPEAGTAKVVEEKANEPVAERRFDLADIPTLAETSTRKMAIPDVDLNLGESQKDSSGHKEPHWYEVATKLDLAKVYQEMGDIEGAREILEEVMNEGDADQKSMAKSMLGSLSKS